MSNRARSLLVLERHRDGHRLNYALTIADILGCPALVGESRNHLWRALGARYLIVSTFESSPKIYTPLLLLRLLAGKRSTVIITRGHVTHPARPLWNVVRRLAYRALSAFGLNQLLTITPPEYDHGATMTFVEDLEFWDLGPEQLEAPVATALSELAKGIAAGRQIILVTGTLEVSKGLAFLGALLSRHPELQQRFAFVCAGMVMEPSRVALGELAAIADLWEDRYLDDEEIFSLYQVASGVWCCYHPAYDVSSGIFGRAVQFGKVSIVRAGSIIARLQAHLGSGLEIEYGEIDEAARQIMSHPFKAGRPLSRHEGGRKRLEELIWSHARLRPTDAVEGSVR